MLASIRQILQSTTKKGRSPPELKLQGNAENKMDKISRTFTSHSTCMVQANWKVIQN